MTHDKTDWDAYYANVAPTAHLSRRVTRDALIALIRGAAKGRSTFSICEIGGANSCFADAIMAAVPVARYHIIDNNVFGLELLEKRYGPGGRVSWECCDVLDRAAPSEAFDLVYSVGLIEHFDVPGTREAVAFHARRMKPDGTLVITFPTPTWLYRTTRAAIELIGRWQFPDERPLTFPEVERALSDAGLRPLSRRINWAVILTQGVIAAQRI